MIALASHNFKKCPSKFSPEKKDMDNLLMEKEAHNMNENLKKDAKELLMEITHGKCAYCESPVNATAVLEVEHFRPRNGISGNPGGGGYYWLTYEWSNLLLACRNCNSKKRTKFPIGAKVRRAKIPLEDGRLISSECCIPTSSSLSEEEALLLHPGFDNPEKHFAFLSDGRVKGFTDRGNECIQVLGLNRKQLVLERKKIVDSMVRDIKRILVGIPEYGNGYFENEFERYFCRLLKLQEPTNAYSRLGWFIYNNFDHFIVRDIEGDSLKRLVREAFNYFEWKYKKQGAKAYNSECF